MKPTENIDSHNKVQIAAICDDLVQHSSRIDKLISEEGPINNLVIQGHIEAHLEKMDDSLFDICYKYEITKRPLKEENQSASYNMKLKMQTQRQGMRFLLDNIQKLEAKVKNLISNSTKRAKKTKVGPLGDLSRKLKNDLCRTSYLIQ